MHPGQNEVVNPSVLGVHFPGQNLYLLGPQKEFSVNGFRFSITAVRDGSPRIKGGIHLFDIAKCCVNCSDFRTRDDGRALQGTEGFCSKVAGIVE